MGKQSNWIIAIRACLVTAPASSPCRSGEIGQDHVSLR